MIADVFEWVMMKVMIIRENANFILGGLSIRKWSHSQLPCMMVQLRSWANDLGMKWSNWNTNSCEELLQSDCEKMPKFPRNFLIERPSPLANTYSCGE